MSKKISVIIKEPGKKPRHVNISNTLNNLQKTVGGYIETVTLASDRVIICNEEGRIQRLPWCCNICGADFVGTVILAGIDGDEFADIPATFEQVKRLYPGLWEG
ncbi:MAG: DUF3846 domain-containing protein [Firmicutes bacterium]|nr:DUF3846 domain-containing protein [Bacillota bacterium]